jgi:hypothetical protein
MEFTGRVVRKPFAVGSKSEHAAAWLVTADGEYVLRRIGGLAFGDPVVDALVGKTVRCEGELVNQYLFFSSCQEQ